MKGYPAFFGERFWPGRYVLSVGPADHFGDQPFRRWYWTGRLDDERKPVVTLDQGRAKTFVSARHAYTVAAEVQGLQQWRVKRVRAKETA